MISHLFQSHRPWLRSLEPRLLELFREESSREDLLWDIYGIIVIPFPTVG